MPRTTMNGRSCIVEKFPRHVRGTHAFLLHVGTNIAVIKCIDNTVNLFFQAKSNNET